MITAEKNPAAVATGQWKKLFCFLFLQASGSFSDRERKYPLNYFLGFTGYLQTVGYDALKDVTHVGCMSHLKRKSHDAITALPSGKIAGLAVDVHRYPDCHCKQSRS